MKIDYELAIDHYYDSPKHKKIINNILNKYNGELQSVSDKSGFFIFPDKEKQESANHEFYKVGICADIFINGERK
jgi:hypothetical protein